MAILQIVRGPDAGRKYTLDGTEITILGRQADCTICLPAKAVSRQHAQIVHTPDGYQVEDLDSSNGTFVNGTRLTPHSRVLLSDNDNFEVGPYTFSLHATLPQPPESTENLIIREQINATGPNQSVYGQDPAQKLQTVLEIAQHLARTLDIDDLVDKLLEQLLHLFPQADRGIVLLGDQDRLLVRGQRARHQEDATTQLFSRTIVKKALEEGIGILSDDVRGDTRFEASTTLASLNIHSLLCAPLIGPNKRRLGVIQLDRTRKGRAFVIDDLRLLTTIGLQVATVLDNAALHQEVLREQRLRQELALAREIQQGFLPAEFGEFGDKTLEVYACVHAARQVSGDLYDLLRMDDGRLAFFVGDVSGKGMPAALFMVAVHALSRNLARGTGNSPVSPSHTLVQLNKALAADNPLAMFVTLAHGLYDPKTGQVVWTSAGHPLPLLRRADGHTSEIAHRTGRLLGYETGPLNLTDANLTLNAGDTLVFYTDGFTEAREPAHREMFGLERLKTVIAAFKPTDSLQACADRARAAIADFTASPEQQDDLTLLLLRRNGPAITNH
jgi:serine phosphatase RsbU (regulator of sigma subunit)